MTRFQYDKHDRVMVGLALGKGWTMYEGHLARNDLWDYEGTVPHGWVVGFNCDCIEILGEEPQDTFSMFANDGNDAVLANIYDIDDLAKIADLYAALKAAEDRLRAAGLKEVDE
jgi:hypothetical protein